MPLSGAGLGAKALNSVRGSSVTLASGSRSSGARLTCPHVSYGKELTRSNALNVHTSTKHTRAGQVHSCDICGESFNRKDTLKQHIAMTQKGQRIWPCTKYNMRFGQQAHLNTNKHSMHAKESSPLYNLCSRSFGPLHNLNAHKNTHRRL